MPDREAKRSEIAHVLFIDIVGYSKLLTNEQKARIETLKNIVRGTEQYQRAKAEEKLLGLPTGDGGALVFRKRSRSAGSLRHGGQPRAKKSSRTSGAHGYSQRTGERGQRLKSTSQCRRRRH